MARAVLPFHPGDDRRPAVGGSHLRHRAKGQPFEGEGHAAALVPVRVDREAQESALTALREEIVPMVASAPGFVAGYWLEPDNDVGLSVILFDIEEQAPETAPPVGPAPTPGVTVEGVEFRAVVANA